MGAPAISDIGAYVATVPGNVPLLASAGTRTSASIDRQSSVSGCGNFDSCVLVGMIGAITGSPDATTFNVKLTHCDTTGGSFTDLAGAAITQRTTAGTTELDVDLTGAKQFLQIVEVLALTNGSSPKAPVASFLIAGGSNQLPI